MNSCVRSFSVVYYDLYARKRHAPALDGNVTVHTRGTNWEVRLTDMEGRRLVSLLLPHCLEEGMEFEAKGKRLLVGEEQMGAVVLEKEKEREMEKQDGEVSKVASKTISKTVNKVTKKRKKMEESEEEEVLPLKKVSVIQKQLAGGIVQQKKPLYDPKAPNALVLKKESDDPDRCFTVIVDPYLAKHLRPHQREGVQFLFDCVTGKKIVNSENTGIYYGAILADSMGLGKSIQTISLIWTLLKQGFGGVPTIKRAMIVVPASLIENWQKEFQKWLGTERIKTIALSSDKSDHKQLIRDFLTLSSFPVLIIGYEYLRNVLAEFDDALVDLIVCDEGHRLKNSAGNKTSEALLSIQSTSRIILTGTPIQNNIDELYSLCNFVCPGVLGQKNTFRNRFSIPIEEGRYKNAKLSGDEKYEELMKYCAGFYLLSIILSSRFCATAYKRDQCSVFATTKRDDGVLSFE